ncbi:MAG: ABC transporter permease [Acidobacteria bacterium]|nr:ABC transporter permease [Acidobacteriota bacterium]
MIGLWRLLLHLLPASLREAHGAEMTAMLRHDLGRARGAGALVVFVTASVDLVWNAAVAHVEATALDLRDVWRSARRAPGFATSVVVVTAIGVGAATAAFSLADHVLLRPLPFAAPEALVKLWQDQTSRGYSRMELSPGNFEDWRAQSSAFQSMSAYAAGSANAMTPAGPLRLDTAQVSTTLFDTLGVRAALGRTLLAADDAAVATPPVVLSDHVWRSTFAASPGVLGTTVSLNGTAHVVVGVMPAWFEFPTRDVDLWLPLRFVPDDLTDRANVYLRVVARLRPGVTIAQARADLNVVAAGLARTFPEANAQTGATVVALRDEVPRQSRTMLLALAGASVAVLLIACANLASLFLARSVARQRELAVRLAMGARPRRLARQVLTESLALAAAGGGLGAVLAIAIVPAAAALVPTALPVAEAPEADLRMLGLAALATLATGFGFGLVPAWRIARAAGGALRHGARVFGTRGTERLRGLFVASEVAATVVLLVTVGLFLKALWQVQEIDPGFDPRGVVTARTTLPLPTYEAVAARGRFYQQVLDEVRATPGVESAAYTSFLPMVMGGGIWPVLLPGTTVPEDARAASVRFVTPGYFATMRVPLLRGRDVADTDRQDAQYVAIVSRSFAELYWPGQDPLGRHFSTALQERMVVGVVGDVRVRGLERESEPQVYLPAPQVPDGGLAFYMPKDLVVRVSTSPASIVPAVRAAVMRADPQQPLSDVQLMTDVVERQMASRSTQLSVLAAFAGVALLLALVGIHSLLAYVVAARTQEIGVRMALGATRGQVLGLVARRAAWLAAFGVAAGVVVAYATSRSVQALLVGISAADAGTYLAAVTAAVVTTLLGSAWPAWRATQVDPVAAMRAE